MGVSQNVQAPEKVPRVKEVGNTVLQDKMYPII